MFYNLRKSKIFITALSFSAAICYSKLAHAYVDITTSVTTQQNIVSTGALTISYDGDLSVAGQTAVTDFGASSGDQIYGINVYPGVDKGIAASGNNYAIDISNGTTISTGILVSSGRITSDSTDATINLLNVGSMMVGTEEGGKILNTGGGSAVKYQGASSDKLTIRNYDTMSGNVVVIDSIADIYNYKSFTGNIDLSQAASGSTITWVGQLNSGEPSSTITGNITGSGASITTLYAGGDGVTTNGDIDVASLTVSSGDVFTIDNSSDVTLSSGATIGSDAELRIKDGSLSGAINGSDTNVGKITIAADGSFTSTAAIGASYALNELMVNESATFNIGGNVTVANLYNAGGAINFGNSDRIINADVTANNAAASFDFGLASHTINGDFTAIAGNSLKLSVGSLTSYGNLTVSGAATIDADSKIYINTTNNYSIFSEAGTYTILSGGTGSAIGAIDKSKIYINNVNKSSSGLYKLNIVELNNELLLEVEKTELTNLSSADNAIIDALPDDLSGSLQLIVDAIADGTVTAAVLAPQSASPAGSSNASMVSGNVGAMLNVVSGRSSDVAASDQQIASNGNVKLAAAGDEPFFSKLWSKIFGNSVRQGVTSAGGASDTKGYGFVIGGDKKIAKDTYLGLSFGYGQSKTTSDSKRIISDSYQLNAYGIKSLNKLYFDAVLGAAYSRNQSSRGIAAAGVVAKANYGSQTYMARIGSGYNQNLTADNKLLLTPTVAVTFANNSVDKYSEKGADSANLTVKTKSSQFLEARVGTTLSYKGEYRGYQLTPKLNASYGYDFLGQKQTTDSSFAGQTTSFRSQGANVVKGNAVYGLSLDIAKNDISKITLDYSHQYRKHFHGDSGSMNFSYNF